MAMQRPIRYRMTIPMLERREVEVRIPLTPTETEVMACLLAARGVRLTYEQLAQYVWPGEDGGPEFAETAISLAITSLQAKGIAITFNRRLGVILDDVRSPNPTDV